MQFILSILCELLDTSKCLNSMCEIIQFSDYVKLHELSFLLLPLQPLRLSIKINVCSFSESEFKLTTCYINF